MQFIKGMTRQEINEAEWKNPDNWRGPKLLGIYSSKQDTRLVVPRRVRALGWTINAGHPAGRYLLGVIFIVAGLLLAGSIIACLVLMLGLIFAHHGLR